MTVRLHLNCVAMISRAPQVPKRDITVPPIQQQVVSVRERSILRQKNLTPIVPTANLGQAGNLR